MGRTKLYIGVVILSLAALLAGACAGQLDYVPGLEVNNAAEARDTAINYLGTHVGDDAPHMDIDWEEENITPPGLVGRNDIAFTSDEWKITVSHPVVLPENTVYEVVVTSLKLGWHWKGTVEPDGNVTELSAFKQMSEEESQRIAEEFVRNSPTFVFDGIEDTLALVDTITLRCPYCWQFTYEFDSSHAGYGDRTGMVLAEVITPHKAVIVVEQSEITSAVMDQRWDMLGQQIIGELVEKPEGTLSVSELLQNPVYDTEVKLYGKVSLLGQLNCPCFDLTSDGEKMQTWYDLMVQDDGTERPSVSIEGIENGDWVIVTGELKTEGEHSLLNNFWASNIEKM